MCKNIFYLLFLSDYYVLKEIHEWMQYNVEIYFSII